MDTKGTNCLMHREPCVSRFFSIAPVAGPGSGQPRPPSTSFAGIGPLTFDLRPMTLPATQPTHRTAAFTLVELISGMLMVSILSLTAGSMLVFGYKAWATNGKAIEVQRDATHAMDMMSRAVRQAAPTNITVDPTAMKMDTPAGTVAFQAEGTDLVYYYPQGGVTASMTLIEDRMSLLQLNLITNEGVAIQLRVREDDEATETGGFFAFRSR